MNRQPKPVQPIARQAVAAIAMIAAATLLAIGCGGGKEKPAADTATSAAPPGFAVATIAPGSGLATPEPGPKIPPNTTPAMAALGDSIFHGQAAGGLCMTCHGPDAKGTTLAPSLVDGKWYTGDGSYEFIESRIITGMPTPTPPYSVPMIPMGGAQLTPAQINAVGTYIFSISRGKVSPQ